MASMFSFSFCAALSRLLSLALLSSLFAASAATAESVSERKESAYFDALTSKLHPHARDALRRIEGRDRQWLALRAYLRAGDQIEARWSWTQQQIDEFKKTSEYAALLQAVDAVRARFAAANPGHMLLVNTTARSLDTQIERWNENASVAHGARALRGALTQALAQPSYPDSPTASAQAELDRLLQGWFPPKPVGLAAPGLSLHGQLRAIDFAIHKQGRIVAPTTLASVQPIWHGQGWSRKLQHATAGTGFIGPLQTPDEPWHYEYRPQNLSASSSN
jgi:hypothetical protein